MITPEQAAKICHEANKALCEAMDDNSQLPWDLAPTWQKQSAINGVMFCINNPDAPPSSNHENWLKEKVDNGWVYGEVKNPDNKTHPCCVPYEQLPEMQKAKDYLFKSVVESLIKIIAVVPVV